MIVEISNQLTNSNQMTSFISSDLSDSTLSYTETEAASSPNVTQGEFSGEFSYFKYFCSKMLSCSVLNLHVSMACDTIVRLAAVISSPGELMW